MRSLTSPVLLGSATLLAMSLLSALVIWPGWLTPIQLALALLVVMGCYLTAWYLNNSRLSGQLADVARYVEALGRVDFSDAATAEPESFCPNLETQTNARAISRGMFEVISRYASQLNEMEQSYASAEVRLRRITAEFDQLNQVFEGLSYPILAIDSFDEVTLANPSANDLLAGGDAVEGAIANLEKCHALIQLLQDTRKRKTTTQRTAELEFAGKKGNVTYQVTCRNTVADGNASNISGAVAVLTDISEQKAMQRRHAEFVSAVSHEMKTPLAGIKAYVELLVDGDAEDDETREEFLSVINSQAERLERLINNLLNLARIEAGVVQVQKQPQPVNDLLEEAAQVVRPAAERKDITLKTELSTLFLGVLADRDMFLQAVINLLSNAVKYTPDGGTVTLRSRLEDESVVVDVEDTGVGMSSEDCEKVFEKFYRVKHNAEMAAGTGLGLPLAKHIICDVHSGDLWVESVINEGSRFHIRIPSHAYADSALTSG